MCVCQRGCFSRPLSAKHCRFFFLYALAIGDLISHPIATEHLLCTGARPTQLYLAATFIFYVKINDVLICLFVCFLHKLQHTRRLFEIRRLRGQRDQTEGCENPWKGCVSEGCGERERECEGESLVFCTMPHCVCSAHYVLIVAIVAAAALLRRRSFAFTVYTRQSVCVCV